ncbi:Na(+)/H(+) exchange regulatory cofactor NHE-RF2 [Nilaparvata lugens]|uniref:Seminal fluid protein n=1 Tax=Nilaparvata lugens TaxID=108931 RepID=A0A1I9WLK1_NILLU|nr:Na(+)/H(+) exchange regulatory cofactor NHE-RF2 [Nilaparvata lugens]APA34021.1 seminal fluid protein [Nilaparvata lugens]
MSNGSITPNNHVIRLCHIIKWDDFDGYGFNLHAEKGKPWQYIGKVDEGSPAEAAGLKENDRIIEVNGVNIATENHKQVVQRIKAMPDETKLLVVDQEADNYFKSKSIVIKSTHPNVVVMKTPRPGSYLNGTEIEDNHSQKSEKSGLSLDNEVSYKGSSGATTPSSDRKHSPDSSSPEPNDFADENMMQSGNNQNNKNLNAALNLNMTAKELREKLALRKKYDPKKDATIDFKKKYDIVQKL